MPENSVLNQFKDALLSALLNNLPVAIVKNLLKALEQLSTAATDNLIARLESNNAEIRAASQARIQIINSSFPPSF